MCEKLIPSRETCRTTFSAITCSNHLLHHFISLSHRCGEILAHLFLQHLFSSLRFE